MGKGEKRKKGKKKKKKKGRKEKGIEKERKGRRNKRRRKDRQEEGILKKMSSAGFKPVRSFLLIFLFVKREGMGGGTGFTFLYSCATLFAVVQPPVQFLRVLLLPPRPLVHQLCCP